MGRKGRFFFCKEQAGFRTGYSTIDHIFTLVTMVKKKLNNKRGGKVYVAFTDYKKAFDTLDRENLWVAWKLGPLYCSTVRRHSPLAASLSNRLVRRSPQKLLCLA